jgi:hypothetical protein
MEPRPALDRELSAASRVITVPAECRVNTINGIAVVPEFV